MKTRKELIQTKIFTNKEAFKIQLQLWKFREHKIVFTNGCFDLLHLGHVDYLAQASDMGDKLIIGLNTDQSVKKLNKVGDRPLQGENARAMLLASFFFVHAVILFNEETPYELIKTIQPDVLVKGSDYAIKEIVGHDIVLANGGEVKTVDLLKGYSTTSIINKINS